MPRKSVLQSLELASGKHTVACKKCGTKRAHEVTYVNVSVQHLQCHTCRTVRVYLQADVISEDEFTATALDLKALQLQPGQKTPYPYSPRDRFSVGEFLNHQTFGEGYVLAVYQPPVKMAVLFADKSRLLVCGTWTKHASGSTDCATVDPLQVEPAMPPDSESCTEEPNEIPEGDKATCPKCGRAVNRYNLSRTADGKSTTGCTFCVLG